jgi:amidase
MKRRDFIKSTSVVALAFPMIFDSCNTAPDTKQKPVLKSEASAADNFELNEVTIDMLQQRMAKGESTAERITRLYLDRIAAIDHGGVNLNAVIEINPDAVAIAQAMDEERKQGKVRGLLHGIPVLIKDNIDTADKMQTTAGSLALAGNYAQKDAFLVERLRAAGAVILGKTNLSEWANFRSTRSVSGWSSRGGQTKNPYVLDRNPCGSSSGSGTAVAANLCAAAIGTETNGSIACPASINGIVGVKPTVGLVSRSGIIPISHTQDTAGPMARTVRDAALVLNVIAAIDPGDQASAGAVEKIQKDYTVFLKEDGLQGKRIGIERSFLQVHENVDALLQQAITDLKSKGAVVVEIDLLEKIKNDAEEFDVLKFEFKTDLNRYLSGAKGKVKSLKELISFNRAHEDSVMPYFKQEILEASEEKNDLTSTAYREALSKVLATRTIIDDVMKQNKLDAICGPTNGPSWCTDLVNGNHFTGYGMYGPAAMAGYPSISVPMGLVMGLPVGLAFIGRAYDEGQLLGIAFAYEQVSAKRIKPEFLSSVR